MAREKELFRDNLERLDKLFPGRELLNITDVCNLCKIGDIRAKKMFPFVKNGGRYYISKTKLASYLS